MKTRYNADLAQLNTVHGRQWTSWNQIKAPTQYGQNLGEDQDWYRFHDETIHTYLGKIRQIWEDLGVKEPQVLFTLAESYNAASQGLLPNYLYRNDPGHTGLMTVNLYPKTSEASDSAGSILFNNPFKADLDVKAATTANGHYWGKRQEWAMGPEIQAGWWQGINVSPAARQQTYLTVIGHGLKAFFVYYFNEGDNFGTTWGYDQSNAIYTQLRLEQSIPNSCSMDELTNSFWEELQSRMDHQNVVGFDTRALLTGGESALANSEKLYFDAPLDYDVNPRGHFYDLKKIGTQVIQPYADFLARSVEAEDDVALVKDTTNHLPSPLGKQGLDSGIASAEWNAGVLGYLMNAGVNPTHCDR